VDQYLNIKLMDISVTDPDKYPHMVSKWILCCVVSSISFASAFCMYLPTLNLFLVTKHQLQSHVAHRHMLITEDRSSIYRNKKSRGRFVSTFLIITFPFPISLPAVSQELFHPWLRD
jgi:hypothetical protein